MCMCWFVVCGRLDSSAVYHLLCVDVLIKMPVSCKQKVYTWQYTQGHRNRQAELHECIAYSVFTDADIHGWVVNVYTLFC